MVAMLCGGSCYIDRNTMYRIHEYSIRVIVSSIEHVLVQRTVDYSFSY